jgi:hypothetical protein
MFLHKNNLYLLKIILNITLKNQVIDHMIDKKKTNCLLYY